MSADNASQDAITTTTIRTVCEWLGFLTWIEDSWDGEPMHMFVETDACQMLLGINDDTIDADGDFFGLAIEVMAAVNARPGEVERSRLQLSLSVEAAVLLCYTRPPVCDFYYDILQIDNANPTSIATAIIKLAERRALWEREQA